MASGSIHTVDDILDILEHYWLPLDPNQTAEWTHALRALDLDIAVEMVGAFKHASDRRPSVPIFVTACKAAQARGLRTDWFDEQRKKLS